MNRIELRARSIYSAISHSERLAADYFIQNQEHIFQHPLSTLAELSGTSQGAWVRFCKSMGYSGMKELKKAFFDEIHNSVALDGKTSRPFRDIQDYSSVTDISDIVCAGCMEALRMTHRLFDAAAMEGAADAVVRAESVRLFGVGASGTVAADLCQKLLRIGYHAVFVSDFHVALTYFIAATPRDAAILISHSGETSDILAAADQLKKNGVPLIGITKCAPNSLIPKCDHVLYMDSPEVPERSGAISSRAAQFLVTDTLFTAVANRDYARIADNLQRSRTGLAAEHRGEQRG